MDSTLSKLRCAGNYEGLFILRCSPRDYDKYYLSFVVGVSEHLTAVTDQPAPQPGLNRCLPARRRAGL